MRTVPEQQQNVHVVGAQHLVLLGRGDQVADEIRPIVRPILLEDLHETAKGRMPIVTRKARAKHNTAVENAIITSLLRN